MTAPGAAAALSQSAVEQGEQIFASNCAACHMGGGNVIQASRTLKIGDLNDHLEEYRQTPLEAIEHQIEDGKNAMPAYADKLTKRKSLPWRPTWNSKPSKVGEQCPGKA